uniref:Uncharacterized protein n=1 Tax=Arundo donax TaxID=35708 RepID=A0A0A8ZIZ4_ARUDO
MVCYHSNTFCHFSHAYTRLGIKSGLGCGEMPEWFVSCSYKLKAI